MRFALRLALLAALGSCGQAPAPGSAHDPLEAPPVDTARVGSVAEVASWAYRRELQADLDGDGATERLVVTADVELSGSGEALWEDGHRWAVYVAPEGADRTLLYSAFVPNGSVEAAVLTPGADGRRRVLVQERTPQQLRALEVEYLGPGSARSSSSAYYQVDRWLPGTAAQP